MISDVDISQMVSCSDVSPNSRVKLRIKQTMTEG